jgi:hypothetical protein
MRKYFATDFAAIPAIKIANVFFRHPFIVCTGGMCYSIYLTHYALISLVGRLRGSSTCLGFVDRFYLYDCGCRLPLLPANREAVHESKLAGGSPCPTQS